MYSSRVIMVLSIITIIVRQQDYLFTKISRVIFNAYLVDYFNKRQAKRLKCASDPYGLLGVTFLI